MTAIETNKTTSDPRDPRVLALRSREAEAVYARLRGVVMLVGAVRPSALMEGIGRSLLDLPLWGNGAQRGERLLDRWISELHDLMRKRSVGAAHGAGAGGMWLKVMLDAESPAPAARPAAEGVEVVVARDPFEFRGTGGVLHDVARDLSPEDYLVVVSGAQVLAEPLEQLVHVLALRGGDVGVIGHHDGTPSGLMLVRCGVLANIAPLGFVDLKEQALPAIARKHTVIVEQRDAAGMPVRTVRDYVAALRHDHRRRRGELLMQDPFAEDWHSEFALVEDGAQADASVRLFDSVVLAGGRVGANAVLVRSVVCPGGEVSAGERVVDCVVGQGFRKTAGTR